MIHEEQRGEYYVLPVDGSIELTGRENARNIAHVFVRDAPRNRLELWQACRIETNDPLEEFLIEGGREYLRKSVYQKGAGNISRLEVWLRIS